MATAGEVLDIDVVTRCNIVRGTCGQSLHIFCLLAKGILVDGNDVGVGHNAQIGFRDERIGQSAGTGIAIGNRLVAEVAGESQGA